MLMMRKRRGSLIVSVAFRKTEIEYMALRDEEERQDFKIRADTHSDDRRNAEVCEEDWRKGMIMKETDWPGSRPFLVLRDQVRQHNPKVVRFLL